MGIGPRLFQERKAGGERRSTAEYLSDTNEDVRREASEGAKLFEAHTDLVPGLETGRPGLPGEVVTAGGSDREWVPGDHHGTSCE